MATTAQPQGSGGRSGARPSPTARPSGPRPRTGTPGTGANRPAKDFGSDPDVLATRSEEATKRALIIAGRAAEGGVICPGCNKPAGPGKFKVHGDGGWKHFSSDGCHGDAISVLTGTLDVGFRDAVNALVGKPTSVKIEVPDTLPDLPMFKAFRAKIDIEVYNGILIYGQKTGGVAAAQEFYGRWHIAPEVVEASGAVMITDPKHFRENILARFGIERLVACGLFVISNNPKLSDDRRQVCLLNEKWPVAEPHRHPLSGDVLNIQFRASHEQYGRYLQHKAGALPFEGNQKFVNLKGAPPAAQVGAGLDLIDKLEPGQEVRVVEGFKDALAARTMGRNAYGIPGVDYRPADKICQLLARHRVVVALDGDEAGQEGALGKFEIDEATGKTRMVKEGLLPYLQRKGVGNVTPQLLPDGRDVTDLLVEWYATGRAPERGGVPCGCATCVAYRTAHPELVSPASPA